MTFAELKAELRGLINRSDMTDELAASFIQSAQIRLERLLRLSFMQKFVTFNPPRDDGVFRLPPDYLELIDIFTDYGQLERVDTSSYLRQPALGGIPCVFIQTGHDFRMRPFPALTDTLYLRYYAVEPQLTIDDQSNQWSVSSADALKYGAAELAADHFEDERLVRFAQRFEGIVAEMRDQQLQEDFSGPMSVSPSYQYPEDR